MGKIGGNSWLNVIKKAFRSPTKDTNKINKRREEHQQEDDEQKKRGKRRWIFGKHCTSISTTIQHNEANNIAATANPSLSNLSTRRRNNLMSEATDHDTLNQQQRAIEMAITITTAAEAVVATAQAAVDVIQLARPSNITPNYYAAIVIQTAFRGYLARRALCALKGIVKLQALVRGHNARQRARMTLRCIESLVRVQTQLRDQRRRLSYERSLNSTSTESRSHHLATRISILSREGSSNITDESDSYQHTLEQIRAMLQKTKDDAASKREQTLSYTFSHQMWRSRRDRCLGTKEEGRWSDHDDITKQWKRMGRNFFDQRDPIQTVDIDNAKSYSSDSAPTSYRSQNHYHNFERQKHNTDIVSSPIRRTNKNLCIHSHTTPYPSETRPLQVHSASPRCLKEERKCMMAGTPKSRSNRRDGHEYAGAASMPNYMAATASTKARIQSQDASRHGPLTPERDKMVFAKKRLSFPDPDEAYSGFGMSDVELEHNLRSPSYQGISDQGRLSSTFCCCEENF